MNLFENKIGRPSNETLKKRRIVYAIVAALVVANISCFFILGKSLLELEKLRGSVSTVNRFVVKKKGTCYTITAPKDAINWKYAVYYKKKGTVSFNNNIIKDISKNHFNDGIKSEKICITRQKYDKETYRIMLKWTTGENNNAYSKVSIKKWRPNGWKYNSKQGYTYKDLNVTWKKVTTKRTTKTTVKTEETESF